MESQCCKSVSPVSPTIVSGDPIAQMIVLDYYDGPAGGFLKCRGCGTEYHFFMLDWDDLHEVRVFALAPIPASSFQGICALLGANPDSRVWIPPVLSRASEEVVSELYEGGLQEVIDHAATPTAVLAWSTRTEKVLAMRGVDSEAALHLSQWFDRQPQPVAFDWFGYLDRGALTPR